MRSFLVGARASLTIVLLSIACLLDACSSITPTQVVEITVLPVADTPVLSPTVVQNLNPIFGEPRPTQFESTPLPVQAPTLLPSLTPTLADTPTPTEPAPPTPTPTDPITWAAGVPSPLVIDYYKGEWLALQQGMVGSYFDVADSGSISVSLAPRFAPEAVSNGSNSYLGNQFLASPNGRWGLVGAVEQEEFDPEGNEVSTLARLNLQESRLLPLLPELGYLRWVNYLGWLDGNTAAISDYAGGGFYNYSIVDVANNVLISRVQLHGPAWVPNLAYLPMAEEYGGPYRLLVLARSIQNNAYDTLLGPNLFMQGFPSNYIAPDMNTIYKGWLPGTNRMLVQAFLFNRNTSTTTHSELMLWSVDTGIVQIVVQGAVDGKFSPDGMQLAFVTFGAAALTDEGLPSFDLGPQIVQTSQPYLQLMDVNTRKVTLSLPVVVTIDRSIPYTLNIYDTPIDFSSDSHYLAFLTPGMLLTDPTGKLVVLPISQESAPYLSVLDLSSFQPLLSTPVRTGKDFYFSPGSDKLAFMGKEGNWYVLKMATSQVSSLTAGQGDRLQWNGWSFDGVYISFYEPLEGRLGRTFIFSPVP
jgi:hypothetical protein